jgi:hypothetical protein
VSVGAEPSVTLSLLEDIMQERVIAVVIHSA